MDILTERKMRAFARRFGFDGKDGEVFEQYIAYTYLYKFLKGEVNLIDEVVIGGGSDGGIDIAAVIINGSIILDPGDLESSLNDGDNNSIFVVFIQAKTSENYDTKLVSKFLHGVEQITEYAAGRTSKPIARGLRPTADILDAALSNITRFNSSRIPAEIVYVTTSKNKFELSGPDHSQAISAEERLNNLTVFQDNIKCRFDGRDEIEIQESSQTGPKNVSFSFPKRQPIPEANGVEQAYIGIISADELLKLLRTDAGVRPGIFTDNVRRYQGDDNRVNQDIFATLVSGNQESFPFLNNGLTMIAKELNNVADRFTASRYQIVNGGQTSHQIVRWETTLLATRQPEQVHASLSNLWIPIKIISTTSTDILTSVTVATNLQSAIGAAEIQSSQKSAKDVEAFFAHSGSGAEGLRYARQNGTDTDTLDVPQLRVVTTPDLDRAVAACIFGESAKSIGSPNELYATDSFVWANHPVEYTTLRLG